METKIRKALTKAGHGAVATDTFGGDALLGFSTHKSGPLVYVGFGTKVGQGYRFNHDAIEAMRPVMLDSFADTLRDAGYCATVEGNSVRVAV